MARNKQTTKASEKDFFELVKAIPAKVRAGKRKDSIMGHGANIAHDAPMRPARKLNLAQLASLGVDVELQKKGKAQI